MLIRKKNCLLAIDFNHQRFAKHETAKLFQFFTVFLAIGICALAPAIYILLNLSSNTFF
jgi:hypothetical protein